MQSGTEMAARPGRRSILGVSAFIASLVALFSTLMVTLTSLLPNFNPPNWIRILTILPLPFALLAAYILGGISLAKKTGRGWGIAGLILATLAIIAFIVLVSVAGG